MNLAACQIPYKPCFDRAEKKLAVLGSFSRSFNIVEYPFDFCAGKVCVDKKTCMLTDIVAETFLLEPFAQLGGAAALPHYSVVYRLTGLLVPYNSGLTLIGYAYAGDFLTSKSPELITVEMECI